MNSIPTISEVEYQVMKIIWELAPISPNDIIASLEQKLSEGR
ncbi:MAG: BlaI/MecI/CopY family transcriptional regulator [Oscillospiraceae bacterium]|nr:BlaI/MecI/CopY family transcriptional regulator [Oscillospiraceae bacterium]